MTCMARWLDIGQVTVLGQHAAILTKQAWSVKNLLSFVAKRNFFSLSRWSWLGKIGLQSQLWFNDIILHLLFYLTGTCTLNVVAMALSGYTEEKKTLWRDMCRSLCGQVSWCRTTIKTQIILFCSCYWMQYSRNACLIVSFIATVCCEMVWWEFP